MSENSEDQEKGITAIEAIADFYDADVLFYSGEIDYEGYGKLVSLALPTKPNVVLILVTNGGSANAGYLIARLMQKMWSGGKFYLYLPSYCKSAGALVALGAHSLLVDWNSEIGPLDVQLLKQDEIGTRRSGLVSKSTFDALESASFGLFEHLMLAMKRKSGDLISFKLAADISSRMTGDLMAPIYGQISPDTIGSDWRDLQVALHYGIRLVRHAGNASFATVHALIHTYPSHDFIIDDDEIRDLFDEVDFPHDDIYGVMHYLTELHGEAAYDEDQRGIVLNLSALKAKLRADADVGQNEHKDGDDDEEQDSDQSEGSGSEPEGVARHEADDRSSNHEP